MESGRQLMKNFLDQAPLSRPFFMPFVFGLLSRIEKDTMETLTADPQLWTNSLAKTARLFGFDGVAAGLDRHFAATACGCKMQWADDRPQGTTLQGELNASPLQTPQLQTGLEVARRLFDGCRQDLGCTVFLPGPCALAAQVFGSGPEHMKKIKPLLVEMTEAFCGAAPDLIVFLENRSLSGAEIDISHRRIYKTLKNIASYYDIPVGLFIEEYEIDHISAFSKLDMDIYIPGRDANGRLPMPSQVWDLGEDTLGLGLSLPLDDPAQAGTIISEAVTLYRERSGHGFFFTGSDLAAPAADLESIHTLVNEIIKLT